MYATSICFENILFLAWLGSPKYDTAPQVGGIYQQDMSQFVYLQGNIRVIFNIDV